MVQRPRPNYALRQQVTELRRRGLTLSEIGQQLGVTRQAVSSLIHLAALPVSRGVPCTACRTLIATPAGRPEDRAGALCLRCLDKAQDATTGQRLRAYRLAAGLSRAEVAWLAGIPAVAVQYAEREKVPKTSDLLLRMSRVLDLPEAPGVCSIWLPRAAFQGIRVLLAVAESNPRCRTGRELASHCHVVRHTTIASLRSNGLLVAGKGPAYGYRLARPAEEIRLLDVVEAVGWSIDLELPTLPVKGGAKLHRRLEAACGEAAEAGRAMLRAVSLADLLDGEGRG
jgi:DNA-binding IscR family transcriptional regulator/DNA-binding XRE family transcriptional regulator